MIDRLSDDHANARVLADGANRIPGLSVKSVETNIVFIDIAADSPIMAPDLVKQLASQRIKVGLWGPKRMRAITHCYVSRAEVDEVLQVLAHSMAAATPQNSIESGPKSAYA